VRLAYLTPQYPKVSHTFIRRELRELERLGHEVARVSIRRPEGEVVDPADVEERERTLVCLDLPLSRQLSSCLRLLLEQPGRVLAELARALRGRGVGVVRRCAYLAEAATLLAEMRRREIAHVHVHFGTNAADVARLIRRFGGPSFSMTLHGPDEWDAPRALEIREKIHASAFTVAISRFASAQARRWADAADWERIRIVHCSVGDDFFDAATPIEAGASTFVFVGRLTAQKAPLLLIDALAEVVARGLDVRLVLAGDGELRSATEARIRARGLEDRVEITGWIDEEEVRRRIVASRCLVLPSFAEGLPVVIMEALALGRPVVSTYVGGIPELVRPGENGWLVPAGDAKALADAMEEVSRTPTATLDVMAAAGARLVRARHRAAVEAGKLDALLRRFVGEG
jgi:glycosyltransferase involved in cell wall biosynthesis